MLPLPLTLTLNLTSPTAAMRRSASLSRNPSLPHASHGMPRARNVSGVSHLCSAASSGGAAPPCPHGRVASLRCTAPTKSTSRRYQFNLPLQPWSPILLASPPCCLRLPACWQPPACWQRPSAPPSWRTLTKPASLSRMASLRPMRSVTLATSNPNPDPNPDPDPSPNPNPNPNPNQACVPSPGRRAS